ncbi:MAG: hypothetical protein ACM3YO_05525 [Bacteroidota bacterium]
MKHRPQLFAFSALSTFFAFFAPAFALTAEDVAKVRTQSWEQATPFEIEDYYRFVLDAEPLFRQNKAKKATNEEWKATLTSLLDKHEKVRAFMLEPGLFRFLGTYAESLVLEATPSFPKLGIEDVKSGIRVSAARPLWLNKKFPIVDQTRSFDIFFSKKTEFKAGDRVEVLGLPLGPFSGTYLLYGLDVRKVSDTAFPQTQLTP